MTTGFFDFTKQAQQYAPPTMEKNFFSRTIGMWPQYGYSWEPNLKTAAERPMEIGKDVAVAPVPVPKAGDTSYTTLGGRPLMIMRTTPERQALSEACRDGDIRLDLSSAFALRPEQKEEIVRALQSIAGREIPCELHVDEGLIAGARISVGPWVLRANLKDELSYFAEGAHATH